MNDFVRCNKITGVHWLKGDVNKLKIRIKLNPPEDIISLPKFEDYTNESKTLSLEQNIEEFSLPWQEKLFSGYELQHYSDVHNCLTENELKYNEMIKCNELTPNKVFTYVHEDYYTSLPQEKKKKISSLNSCLEHLNLDDAVGRIGDAFGGKSISEKHLFRSQEEFSDEEQCWTAMHVVFDNSDYDDESLILRQEATLVSLYHNTVHNYIIITPDVNNLETNPYVVETNAGELLGYQYEVDVNFGESEDGDELVTLLTKLYKKWEKKHKQLVNFVMAPLGKIQFYVTIDLSSAKCFEANDLYIEFDVKLPEGVQSNDALHGRTHIAEVTFLEDERVWHFGHLIELCLEVDYGNDVPPINIYFEAISTDMWHCHRTEGYGHVPLRLSPALRTLRLRCLRPEEFGGEERRFFVGGCHLLRKIEVLSHPEVQNGDYTFTETGSLQIRTAIISQSSLPTTHSPAVQQEASTASALLLGAEAALRKYKKARARLAHATTTN